MAKMDVGSRQKERRAFWFGLGIGLFVFMTAAGLIVVDYQGRKLSFGDSAPPISLDRQSNPPRLQVKVFGVEESWDASKIKEAMDFLCDFGCLPHK